MLFAYSANPPECVLECTPQVFQCLAATSVESYNHELYKDRNSKDPEHNKPDPITEYVNTNRWDR